MLFFSIRLLLNVESPNPRNPPGDVIDNGHGKEDHLYPENVINGGFPGSNGRKKEWYKAGLAGVSEILIENVYFAGLIDYDFEC